ncbi:MAG: amidophosphoribosyltransferase [Clostridiales bacterium]|nr:amidophosphoribosyltransferase [Candidatus Scatonaster coprocaballi]
MSRKWQEECGVFGVFDTKKTSPDISKLTYYGIFSLQHRGQASAGIVVNHDGTFLCHKAPGLVSDVFDELHLGALSGHAALGHVRTPASGESGFDVVQPMQIKSHSGQIAISMNGSIMNASELRESLKEIGAFFQTTADFEVLLALIARNRVATDSLEGAIAKMMTEISGAYAMLFMSEDRIIGVRDPLGLRPLVLGKKDDMYMLASETCAFDAIGAETIRDVLPGEIITITEEGVSSIYTVPETSAHKDGKLCIFEFVYLARPDSFMDGTSVYASRVNTGKALARECPCDADLVVAAPDSGIAAAIGYAEESGITYGQALLKNRYVGRTFIEGTQSAREMAVRLKFSVLKTAVKDKKIVIVDDSVVRGTTTRHIISFLREEGAKEVHLRVASPPVKFPCYYGVSASESSELPARTKSVEEICKEIGADSLGYVSLEGLKASTNGALCGHCSACFDGIFPAGVPAGAEEENK